MLLELSKSLYFLFICLVSHSFFLGQDAAFEVANIRIVGNDKTKEFVIHRELTFSIVDTLSYSLIDAELQKSLLNLQNTSLFNFVTVEHHPVDARYTEVLIVVTERWYVWPFPILEVADPNFNTWLETKNFTRINWGSMIANRNFRGRKEQLGFVFQLGYSKKIGFFYDVPYTEKHQNFGFGAHSSYFQNYEVVYGTNRNKRLFTRPTGKSKEEWYNALYLKYRNKIFVSHQLMAVFQDVMVEDSVVINNANYFGDSESRMKSLGLKYVFKDYHRDNASYPLKGYFLQAEFQHNGFSLFSNQSFTKIEAEVKKFDMIWRDFYWASSAKGKFTFQEFQSYYFQNMLGYNDFVRGYEYYVIDGKYALLLKSNIKYKITSSKKTMLPLVRNPGISNFHYAFYLNAFVDVGFVGDDYFVNNLLANNTMVGYGVGLDFVTYYDKVIRVDFSTNKLNEVGFFLHFVQPI